MKNTKTMMIKNLAIKVTLGSSTEAHVTYDGMEHRSYRPAVNWLARRYGFSCHNPSIRINRDGEAWVSPDSQLVSLDDDEAEMEIDSLGDLDPDGEMKKIVARLDDSTYDLDYVEKRHPKLFARIVEKIENHLDKFATGCIPWIEDCINSYDWSAE